MKDNYDDYNGERFDGDNYEDLHGDHKSDIGFREEHESMENNCDGGGKDKKDCVSAQKVIEVNMKSPIGALDKNSLDKIQNFVSSNEGHLAGKDNNIELTINDLNDGGGNENSKIDSLKYERGPMENLGEAMKAGDERLKLQNLEPKFENDPVRMETGESSKSDIEPIRSESESSYKTESDQFQNENDAIQTRSDSYMSKSDASALNEEDEHSKNGENVPQDGSDQLNIEVGDAMLPQGYKEEEERRVQEKFGKETNDLINLYQNVQDYGAHLKNPDLLLEKVTHKGSGSYDTKSNAYKRSNTTRVDLNKAKPIVKRNDKSLKLPKKNNTHTGITRPVFKNMKEKTHHHHHQHHHHPKINKNNKLNVTNKSNITIGRINMENTHITKTNFYKNHTKKAIKKNKSITSENLKTYQQEIHSSFFPDSYVGDNFAKDEEIARNEEDKEREKEEEDYEKQPPTRHDFNFKEDEGDEPSDDDVDDETNHNDKAENMLPKGYLADESENLNHKMQKEAEAIKDLFQDVVIKEGGSLKPEETFLEKVVRLTGTSWGLDKRSKKKARKLVHHNGFVGNSTKIAENKFNLPKNIATMHLNLHAADVNGTTQLERNIIKNVTTGYRRENVEEIISATKKTEEYGFSTSFKTPNGTHKFEAKYDYNGPKYESKYQGPTHQYEYKWPKDGGYQFSGDDEQPEDAKKRSNNLHILTNKKLITKHKLKGVYTNDKNNTTNYTPFISKQYNLTKSAIKNKSYQLSDSLSRYNEETSNKKMQRKNQKLRNYKTKNSQRSNKQAIQSEKVSDENNILLFQQVSKKKSLSPNFPNKSIHNQSKHYSEQDYKSFKNPNKHSGPVFEYEYKSPEDPESDYLKSKENYKRENMHGKDNHISIGKLNNTMQDQSIHAIQIANKSVEPLREQSHKFENTYRQNKKYFHQSGVYLDPDAHEKLRYGQSRPLYRYKYDSSPGQNDDYEDGENDEKSRKHKKVEVMDSLARKRIATINKASDWTLISNETILLPNHHLGNKTIESLKTYTYGSKGMGHRKKNHLHPSGFHLDPDPYEYRYKYKYKPLYKHGNYSPADYGDAYEDKKKRTHGRVGTIIPINKKIRNETTYKKLVIHKFGNKNTESTQELTHGSKDLNLRNKNYLHQSGLYYDPDSYRNPHYQHSGPLYSYDYDSPIDHEDDYGEDETDNKKRTHDTVEKINPPKENIISSVDDVNNKQLITNKTISLPNYEFGSKQVEFSNKHALSSNNISRRNKNYLHQSGLYYDPDAYKNPHYQHSGPLYSYDYDSPADHEDDYEEDETDKKKRTHTIITAGESANAKLTSPITDLGSQNLLANKTVLPYHHVEMHEYNEHENGPHCYEDHYDREGPHREEHHYEDHPDDYDYDYTPERHVEYNDYDGDDEDNDDYYDKRVKVKLKLPSHKIKLKHPTVVIRHHCDPHCTHTHDEHHHGHHGPDDHHHIHEHHGKQYKIYHEIHGKHHYLRYEDKHGHCHECCHCPGHHHHQHHSPHHHHEVHHDPHHHHDSHHHHGKHCDHHHENEHHHHPHHHHCHCHHFSGDYKRKKSRKNRKNIKLLRRSKSNNIRSNVFDISNVERMDTSLGFYHPVLLEGFIPYKRGYIKSRYQIENGNIPTMIFNNKVNNSPRGIMKKYAHANKAPIKKFKNTWKLKQSEMLHNASSQAFSVNHTTDEHLKSVRISKLVKKDMPLPINPFLVSRYHHCHDPHHHHCHTHDEHHHSHHHPDDHHHIHEHQGKHFKVIHEIHGKHHKYHYEDDSGRHHDSDHSPGHHHNKHHSPHHDHEDHHDHEHHHPHHHDCHGHHYPCHHHFHGYYDKQKKHRKYKDHNRKSVKSINNMKRKSKTSKSKFSFKKKNQKMSANPEKREKATVVIKKNSNYEIIHNAKNRKYNKKQSELEWLMSEYSPENIQNKDDSSLQNEEVKNNLTDDFGNQDDGNKNFDLTTYDENEIDDLNNETGFEGRDSSKESEDSKSQYQGRNENQENNIKDTGNKGYRNMKLNENVKDQKTDINENLQNNIDNTENSCCDKNLPDTERDPFFPQGYLDNQKQDINEKVKHQNEKVERLFEDIARAQEVDKKPEEAFLEKIINMTQSPWGTNKRSLKYFHPKLNNGYNLVNETIRKNKIKTIHIHEQTPEEKESNTETFRKQSPRFMKGNKRHKTSEVELLVESYHHPNTNRVHKNYVKSYEGIDNKEGENGFDEIDDDEHVSTERKFNSDKAENMLPYGYIENEHKAMEKTMQGEVDKIQNLFNEVSQQSKVEKMTRKPEEEFLERAVTLTSTPWGLDNGSYMANKALLSQKDDSARVPIENKDRMEINEAVRMAGKDPILERFVSQGVDLTYKNKNRNISKYVKKLIQNNSIGKNKSELKKIKKIPKMTRNKLINTTHYDFGESVNKIIEPIVLNGVFPLASMPSLHRNVQKNPSQSSLLQPKQRTGTTKQAFHPKNTKENTVAGYKNVSFLRSRQLQKQKRNKKELYQRSEPLPMTNDFVVPQVVSVKEKDTARLLSVGYEQGYERQKILNNKNFKINDGNNQHATKNYLNERESSIIHTGKVNDESGWKRNLVNQNEETIDENERKLEEGFRGTVLPLSYLSDEHNFIDDKVSHENNAVAKLFNRYTQGSNKPEEAFLDKIVKLTETSWGLNKRTVGKNSTNLSEISNYGNIGSNLHKHINNENVTKRANLATDKRASMNELQWLMKEFKPTVEPSEKEELNQIMNYQHETNKNLSNSVKVSFNDKQYKNLYHDARNIEKELEKQNYYNPKFHEQQTKNSNKISQKGFKEDNEHRHQVNEVDFNPSYKVQNDKPFNANKLPFIPKEDKDAHEKQFRESKNGFNNNKSHLDEEKNYDDEVDDDDEDDDDDDCEDEDENGYRKNLLIRKPLFRKNNITDAIPTGKEARWLMKTFKPTNANYLIEESKEILQFVENSSTYKPSLKKSDLSYDSIDTVGLTLNDILKSQKKNAAKRCKHKQKKHKSLNLQLNRPYFNEVVSPNNAYRKHMLTNYPKNKTNSIKHNFERTKNAVKIKRQNVSAEHHGISKNKIHNLKTKTVTSSSNITTQGNSKGKKKHKNKKVRKKNKIKRFNINEIEWLLTGKKNSPKRQIRMTTKAQKKGDLQYYPKDPFRQPHVQPIVTYGNESPKFHEFLNEYEDENPSSPFIVDNDMEYNDRYPSNKKHYHNHELHVKEYDSNDKVHQTIKRVETGRVVQENGYSRHFTDPVQLTKDLLSNSEAYHADKNVGGFSSRPEVHSNFHEGNNDAALHNGDMVIHDEHPTVAAEHGNYGKGNYDSDAVSRNNYHGDHFGSLPPPPNREDKYHHFGNELKNKKYSDEHDDRDHRMHDSHHDDHDHYPEHDHEHDDQHYHDSPKDSKYYDHDEHDDHGDRHDREEKKYHYDDHSNKYHDDHHDNHHNDHQDDHREERHHDNNEDSHYGKPYYEKPHRDEHYDHHDPDYDDDEQDRDHEEYHGPRHTHHESREHPPSEPNDAHWHDDEHDHDHDHHQKDYDNDNNYNDDHHNQRHDTEYDDHHHHDDPPPKHHEDNSHHDHDDNRYHDEERHNDDHNDDGYDDHDSRHEKANINIPHEVAKEIHSIYENHNIGNHNEFDNIQHDHDHDEKIEQRNYDSKFHDIFPEEHHSEENHDDFEMDHQIGFETHETVPPAKYSDTYEKHNSHDNQDNNEETHNPHDVQDAHVNDHADEVHNESDVKSYAYPEEHSHFDDNQKSDGTHNFEDSQKTNEEHQNKEQTHKKEENKNLPIHGITIEGAKLADSSHPSHLFLQHNNEKMHAMQMVNKLYQMQNHRDDEDEKEHHFFNSSDDDQEERKHKVQYGDEDKQNDVNNKSVQDKGESRINKEKENDEDISDIQRLSKDFFSDNNKLSTDANLGTRSSQEHSGTKQDSYDEGSYKEGHGRGSDYNDDYFDENKESKSEKEKRHGKETFNRGDQKEDSTGLKGISNAHFDQLFSLHTGDIRAEKKSTEHHVYPRNSFVDEKGESENIDIENDLEAIEHDTKNVSSAAKYSATNNDSIEKDHSNVNGRYQEKKANAENVIDENKEKPYENNTGFSEKYKSERQAESHNKEHDTLTYQRHEKHKNDNIYEKESIQPHKKRNKKNDGRKKLTGDLRRKRRSSLMKKKVIEQEIKKQNNKTKHNFNKKDVSITDVTSKRKLYLVSSNIHGKQKHQQPKRSVMKKYSTKRNENNKLRHNSHFQREKITGKKDNKLDNGKRNEAYSDTETDYDVEEEDRKLEQEGHYSQQYLPIEPSGPLNSNLHQFNYHHDDEEQNFDPEYLEKIMPKHIKKTEHERVVNKLNKENNELKNLFNDITENQERQPEERFVGEAAHLVATKWGLNGNMGYKVHYPRVQHTNNDFHKIIINLNDEGIPEEQYETERAHKNPEPKEVYDDYDDPEDDDHDKEDEGDDEEDDDKRSIIKIREENNTQTKRSPISNTTKTVLKSKKYKDSTRLKKHEKHKIDRNTTKWTKNEKEIEEKIINNIEKDEQKLLADTEAAEKIKKLIQPFGDLVIKEDIDADSFFKLRQIVDPFIQSRYDELFAQAPTMNQITSNQDITGYRKSYAPTPGFSDTLRKYGNFRKNEEINGKNRHTRNKLFIRCTNANDCGEVEKSGKEYISIFKKL